MRGTQQRQQGHKGESSGYHEAERTIRRALDRFAPFQILVHDPLSLDSEFLQTSYADLLRLVESKSKFACSGRALTELDGTRSTRARTLLTSELPPCVHPCSTAHEVEFRASFILRCWGSPHYDGGGCRLSAGQDTIAKTVTHAEVSQATRSPENFRVQEHNQRARLQNRLSPPRTAYSTFSTTIQKPGA